MAEVVLRRRTNRNGKPPKTGRIGDHTGNRLGVKRPRGGCAAHRETVGPEAIARYHPDSMQRIVLAAAGLAATVVLGGGSTGAFAAAPPLRPIAPPDTPAASGGVRLVSDPVVLEGLGLSIRPPADAIVAREFGAGGVALLVAESAENPRWRLRLQSLAASVDTPTAAMVVQDHMNRLNVAKEPFTVIAAEPSRYGGVAGEMLVVQQRGRDGNPVVNGWLVLPRGGLSFTVATLATTPGDLPAARAALEAMLGSMELADIDRLIEHRMARLDAGDRVVRLFTPEALRRLVGPEHWYRMYRPASSGTEEREVGYMQMRVVEAMRGELDPSRAIEQLRGEEAEQGLMLIARSRGLLADDGSRLVDVEARYWMAWDRSTEAWSSRTTERDGKTVRAYAQTGIRMPAGIGQPSVLTVVNTRAGAAPDPADRPKEWSVPQRAYLCMPEALLLGSLLSSLGSTTIGEGASEAELAFFSYDTKGSRLPQRLDRWRRSDGGWTLVTQPAQDEPTITQFFDDAGRRLRRVDADGVVTERLEPSALLALWKAKGLSTGDDHPSGRDRDPRRGSGGGRGRAPRETRP